MAVLGLAAALLASRVTVTPAGGQPVVAWPGVPLAVAAAGLLLAAAAAADGLGRTLSAGGRTGLRRLASARGVPVAILALAACTAPVLAAAYWVTNGDQRPDRAGRWPGRAVAGIQHGRAGTAASHAGADVRGRPRVVPAAARGQPAVRRSGPDAGARGSGGARQRRCRAGGAGRRRGSQPEPAARQVRHRVRAHAHPDR